MADFKAKYGRFIPAGAGNTRGAARREYPIPVYPRWRGEHFFRQATTLNLAGLSPLARGTRHSCAIVETSKRFIPAGAGNTFNTCSIASLFAVYPRWRGEHLIALSSFSLRRGLSPLARGTPALSPRLPLTVRFIPAGAGNTITLCFRHHLPPVYPRWRGEHTSMYL